jgi:hypothetical protein
MAPTHRIWALAAGRHSWKIVVLEVEKNNGVVESSILESPFTSKGKMDIDVITSPQNILRRDMSSGMVDHMAPTHRSGKTFLQLRHGPPSLNTF